MADWTTDAVDALDQAIGLVRDKTVVPAQKASRAVVSGLLVSFFAIVAFLLFSIGLFRALVIITDEVWLSYLILGGIFVAAGAFCWGLRSPRAKDANA